MKCMFQDCNCESTRKIKATIGQDKEPVDIHVCDLHYDLIENRETIVSMELKENE